MRKGAQKNSTFSGGYPLLENNGVLNQSVVGAPFVNMLQTMCLGNGSQNLSRKTAKIFFENSCKVLSKRLSRADFGRNKVIGGRLRSKFQN